MSKCSRCKRELAKPAFTDGALTLGPVCVQRLGLAQKVAEAKASARAPRMTKEQREEAEFLKRQEPLWPELRA